MPAVHNPNPNRASRPRPTLARADPPAPPMAVAVPLPARGAVALSAQPVAARPVQAPTPLAAAPAQTDVCPHLRARLPTYRALLRCTRACAHYLARSGVNRAARLPCCRQSAGVQQRRSLPHFGDCGEPYAPSCAINSPASRALQRCARALAHSLARSGANVAGPRLPCVLPCVLLCMPN